jgi:phospholipase C
MKTVLVTVLSSLSMPLAILTLTAGRTLAAGNAAIPIDNIIIIVQENHSFDNYFGTYPNANGIPANTMLPLVPGGPLVLKPFLAKTKTPHDLQHAWVAAALAYDNGLMDGFYWSAYIESAAYYGQSITVPQPDPNLVQIAPTPTPTPTPPNSPPKQPSWAINALSYYDSTVIPNYWNYAQNYTLCDNFFSALRGPSLPNHLYTVAAQSGEVVRNYSHTYKLTYSFPEIMDELLQAGVSWKYYTGQPNPHVQGVWNPLPGFPQITSNPAQFANVVSTSQFYTDIKNLTLPQVCWLIPSGQNSEHPPHDITIGMAYVTKLVNTVMQSKYWQNCAIIITWDDYGGFYDHVPPIQTDQNGFGFRVPCLVISPYALSNTIVHTQYDLTSILKFIETKFVLSSLTGRDSAANNMLDCFNFTQTPLPTDIIH